MKTVLIDNYDSFTFNLYQMLQSSSSGEVYVYRNDSISFNELCCVKPSHIVLSPGPGHPANQDDFGVCGEIVTRQQELNCPVLGVCLGHQGIVHYCGGTVVRAPKIVHGKTSRIKITGKSTLFDRLNEQFVAMRYHSLVAQEEGLPPALDVIAREEEYNLIMAIIHKQKRLYGVQFHPESIGTPEGLKILENFLTKC